MVRRRTIDTPSGPAVVHLYGWGQDLLLILGHGAGGGPAALRSPDLLASIAAALEVGAGSGVAVSAALVQQPWHVAGRRIAEAPARLDAAWLAVLEQLAPVRPFVVGGRSAGARVACRTATAVGAAGVLALAFPLAPPGRPERSRQPELDQPQAPVLVVQGSRDSFGVPRAGTSLDVQVVEGADHGFGVRRKDGRTPAQVSTHVQAVVRQHLLRVWRTPGDTGDQ